MEWDGMRKLILFLIVAAFMAVPVWAMPDITIGYGADLRQGQMVRISVPGAVLLGSLVVLAL